MNVLAFYNIKGGVGKTAAAVNIAYLAAKSGLNTLICDLDPQSASTFYFRVQPRVRRGAKLLLKAGKKLDASIKATDYERLDILPADFSFRNIDLIFGEAKKSKKRLAEFLKALEDRYQVVILDCPPNLTLLSENVFTAAGFIVTPVIPTTLSMRTHGQLVTFLKEQGPKKGLHLFPFLSMVERRKKMHMDLCQSLRAAYPEFLQTAIPYLSEVEKMGIHRQPVGSFSNGTAARAYEALWQEICRKAGDLGQPMPEAQPLPAFI